MEMMKGLKYLLTDHPKANDRWAVQLTDGKYDGLVYAYGKVDFVEADQEGATLSFEYDVLEPIEIDVENLTGKDYEEFKSLLGDILVELIEESLEYHENRNDNPEESGQQ